MSTLRVRLFSAQQAHREFTEAYQALKPSLIAGKRFDLTIKPETRTTAQNRRLWSMLTQLSEQVVWHGQKLTPEDWKTMCTAALKQQRVLPGIEGGFVVMGDSTSQMTIAEMSALMDFMDAFGAQQGVDFSETLEPA